MQAFLFFHCYTPAKSRTHLFHRHLLSSHKVPPAQPCASFLDALCTRSHQRFSSPLSGKKEKRRAKVKEQMNEAERERVAELMAAEVAEEPLCGRR
ncbi:MAG: hypothetical protein RSB14_02295, partial [Kiritimatiellia bacterium]